MANAQLREEPYEELDFADELRAGSTLMRGQYTIMSFLNAGGFGITYSARDSLDRHVVIKECFPGAFCRRSATLVTARSRAHQSELASIVRLFAHEARNLAKLDHPNIVGVHQVFEENNTAYMALDYVDGRDLLDVIESGDTPLNPGEVEMVLRKVLDAIRYVHDQGILHRDISPDNILLDRNNEPVLIDFGAAREQATKQSRVLSALRVVKDGYSPQEFYIAGSAQGPCSDLYALGASFYHLITGEVPPSSQARLAAVAAGDPDPYRPLVDRLPAYRRTFLATLDQSLAILPRDRIRSATAWIDMLDGKCQRPAAQPAPKATVAAKAQPVKKKSGTGLLLASVATLAVIAGGVIATQTDLLEPTVAISDLAPEVSTALDPAPLPAPAAVAPQVRTTPAPKPVAAPAPVLAVPTDRADAVITVDTSVAVAAPVAGTDTEATYEDALRRAATLDRPDYAPRPAPLSAEIPPALERFDAPGMLSGWGAVLPATATFDDTAIDRIIGVNDIATPSRSAFDRALRGTVAAPADTTVTVAVTLQTASGGTQVQSWTLPIVHNTVLLNGMAFETAHDDQGWVTQVTEVPDGLATDLQVGDVLLGHIATGTPLDTRTALPATIAAAANGSADMTFTVMRNDTTRAVDLPVAGATSN